MFRLLDNLEKMIRPYGEKNVFKIEKSSLRRPYGNRITYTH